jgi:hypothetical protein
MEFLRRLRDAHTRRAEEKKPRAVQEQCRNDVSQTLDFVMPFDWHGKGDKTLLSQKSIKPVYPSQPRQEIAAPAVASQAQNVMVSGTAASLSCNKTIQVPSSQSHLEQHANPNNVPPSREEEPPEFDIGKLPIESMSPEALENFSFSKFNKKDYEHLPFEKLSKDQMQALDLRDLGVGVLQRILVSRLCYDGRFPKRHVMVQMITAYLRPKSQG